MERLSSRELEGESDKKKIECEELRKGSEKWREKSEEEC